MKRLRVSWAIVVAVTLATSIVPSLREQATRGRVAVYFLRSLWLTSPNITDRDPVSPLQARAIDFVEQHYPDDPDMLMAAGLVAPNVELAQSRLWRATQVGSAPVYSAAYVNRLLETAPQWERIGSGGVDPGDPAQLASEVERIRESRRPDRMPPEIAIVTLQALHRWEAVEPRNALPWAYQFLYLYAQHRDAEAFRAWQEAGRRPEVRDHSREMTEARARLLTRMGMPAPEARLVSMVSSFFPGLPVLRQAGRYAQYEGRRAQLEGRARDALQWWRATIALGRHLQEGQEMLIPYFTGRALEVQGARYIWAWRPTQGPRPARGSRLDGRFYYGPAHAFYVSQMGEAADAALRDRLVQSAVRAKLLRQAPDASWFSPESALARAGKLIWIGRAALVLSGWLLAVFLLASPVARSRADAAATLGPVGAGLLALAIPFPAVAAIGAVQVLLASPGHEAQPPWLWGLLSSAGLAGSVLFALLLPLTFASRRRPDGDLTTAWRGNVRRALPPALACCALLFLGLNVPAAKLRADWLRVWGKPTASEVDARVRPVRSEWDHPTLPPDAWRAGPPPQEEAH